MDFLLTPPPPRPSFTPEQVAAFFFTPVCDDTGAKTGSWTCKVCARAYKQADGRGFSNLMQHVRAKHQDFEAQMRTASTSATGSLLSWVSPRAQNRFAWIAWIVEENLPLSFCEKPATRRNTQLTPVSRTTLRTDIVRLTEFLEAKIAREIPEKFGLIFDGWTHNSEHFQAIFATYDLDGVVYTPLLSLAPVIDEPEETHNAETHRNAIETVLSFFGKTLSQCVFLVGDNCAVNKKIARLMGVPLVGCASHRLNLAVRLLTDEHDESLESIQQLMIRLRTLNQAAKLRFNTPLRPILRQDTRWGSTFTMLKRFFELLPHLDRDDDVIADLLPSAAATKKLKVLLENLKSVESVSKKIQLMDIQMWEVRTLFDALIELFPSCPTAAIIGYPNFEAAVGKLQRGRHLNRAEKQAVEALKSAVQGGNEADTDDGFADRVLKRARVAERVDRYLLLSAVAPTSNIVERLFSMARAVHRYSLQPIALEAMLFLKSNRDFWDVHAVHECLQTRE